MIQKSDGQFKTIFNRKNQKLEFNYYNNLFYIIMKVT